MARETQAPRSAPLPGASWPTDGDGAPMAMVTMQASELIGLPNYSNVTVGPASVTRFVPDTHESREAGLKECALEAEKIIAEERELVLQIVQQG